MTNEKELRSSCGKLTCTNQAVSLFAWPLRDPVPLCAECKNWVQAQVKDAKSGKSKISERQWLQWAKDNLKPHVQGGK